MNRNYISILNEEAICMKFDKAEIKAKCVNALDNAKDFVRENRELLIVGLPVVGGLLGSVIRKMRTNQQEYLKTNYIYDNRSGVYFQTRKMSNKQKLEYARRRENGEAVSQILESMKVLK